MRGKKNSEQFIFRKNTSCADSLGNDGNDRLVCLLGGETRRC